MDTEKTKGDILAERIEETLKLPYPLMAIGRIREALADYRKPDWTLGRSVNSFTLAEGQEWHRTDWTKDMLPDGWRPLIKGEFAQAGDQYISGSSWYTQKHNSGADANFYVAYQRTRRPLPILTPSQIADGWLEWHGGECPVWVGSKPEVMFRGGAQYDQDTAEEWNWKHHNIEGDIIAYRPDPYEALKKAHSEGKVIQAQNPCVGRRGEWYDLKGSIMWSEPPDHYRIKPSPVMVPLGPEDVKCGDVIRQTRWILGVSVSVIGKNNDGVWWFNATGDFRFNTYSELAEGNEISRDGGKTWQKCEKEAK